jgi:peptidoglycan/xylan/chitin deacetylase (PgdA/CDA1 family)
MGVNNKILPFFDTLAFSMPLSVLISLSGQNLFCPFYHIVNDAEVPHIKHLYKVKGIKGFIKELDYLLKIITPVDFFQLKEIFENHKDNKRNFFLSFDDGLSEIYHIIAPILKQKGIPATFFLNSAFVDNKDLFYRYKASLIIERLQNPNASKKETSLARNILKRYQIRTAGLKKGVLSVGYDQKNALEELAQILEVDFEEYLKAKKPYLTSDQISSLLKDNFTIGAHSIDHPEYRKIPLEEQVRQTKESVHFIIDKFGLKYKTFSFPFTDHGVGKLFFDTMLRPENGTVDLSFGCAGLKEDYLPSHIQRFPMEGAKTPAKNLIHSEYFYYLIKSIFNKNKIARL